MLFTNTVILKITLDSDFNKEDFIEQVLDHPEVEDVIIYEEQDVIAWEEETDTGEVILASTNEVKTTKLKKGNN